MADRVYEFSTNCKSELQEHVECVKAFLRDARTNHEPYLPGSGTEHDRCYGTRDRYQRCMKERKSSNRMTQARQLSKIPEPCEMELNLHGQCVGNWMEVAMKSNKPYLFARDGKGEDKCFLTRANYEKCMLNKDITQTRNLPAVKAEFAKNPAMSGNY